tara:strand:+ start:341 stop:514 length:174 start_codon:yes stop_codon:yes gene_type:complete
VDLLVVVVVQLVEDYLFLKVMQAAIHPQKDMVEVTVDHNPDLRFRLILPVPEAALVE